MKKNSKVYTQPQAIVCTIEAFQPLMAGSTGSGTVNDPDYEEDA